MGCLTNGYSEVARSVGARSANARSLDARSSRSYCTCNQAEVLRTLARIPAQPFRVCCLQGSTPDLAVEGIAPQGSGSVAPWDAAGLSLPCAPHTAAGRYGASSVASQGQAAADNRPAKAEATAVWSRFSLVDLASRYRFAVLLLWMASVASSPWVDTCRLAMVGSRACV